SIVDKKWIGANGGWDGDCKDWQNFYQSSATELNKLKLGTTENGTGPYQLSNWAQGTSVVLQAFDGYWGRQPAWPGGPSGAPRLKKIIIRYGLAVTADRVNDLSTGQADLIDAGSPTEWPKLDALVGETCAEVNLCAASATPSGPLRVFKNLPAASRTD